MRKIGFLGGGNMGRAIIEGLLKAGLYEKENIFVYDVSEKALSTLKNELGIETVKSSTELVKNVDTLILSVKPHILPIVLKECGKELTKKQVIISIAAGVTLDFLESQLSADYKFVRVMPNTPALVGEGMAALCANSQVNQEEQDQVLAIFSSFGKAKFLPERLIDAVVGVSGSGPAYVYLFIEALADGAVLEGMPRNDAYEFAAQTVLGSAKMVLETKRHPGDLKDMVCSPGGTTIEGVKVLEKGGFRGLVMETVHEVAEKNRQMGS